MKFTIQILSILAKNEDKFVTYQFVSKTLLTSPEVKLQMQEYEGNPDWDKKRIIKHLHEENREDIIKTLGNLKRDGYAEISPLKKNTVFLKKVMFSKADELKTNRVVYKITKSGLNRFCLMSEKQKKYLSE
jgi:hypothetical protein